MPILNTYGYYAVRGNIRKRTKTQLEMFTINRRTGFCKQDAVDLAQDNYYFR